MANKGSDTNGSQFFITFDEIPDLNNKYTIIGQTIRGFDMVRKLEKLCGTREGVPKCNIRIKQSGIYNYEEYTKNKKLL
jgi:cyclophilin family peptidyl-prolyl cis-trans isomerase